MNGGSMQMQQILTFKKLEAASSISVLKIRTETIN